MRDTGIERGEFHAFAGGQVGQAAVGHLVAPSGPGFERRQVSGNGLDLVGGQEGLQRLSCQGHADILGPGVRANAKEAQLGQGAGNERLLVHPGVSNGVARVGSENCRQECVDVEEVLHGKSAKAASSS